VRLPALPAIARIPLISLYPLQEKGVGGLPERGGSQGSRCIWVKEVTCKRIGWKELSGGCQLPTTKVVDFLPDLIVKDLIKGIR